MSSWSDWDGAAAVVRNAIEADNRHWAEAVLAEKHGYEFARDVLASLAGDIERCKAEKR